MADHIISATISISSLLGQAFFPGKAFGVPLNQDALRVLTERREKKTKYTCLLFNGDQFLLAARHAVPVAATILFDMGVRFSVHIATVAGIPLAGRSVRE